MALTGLQIFKLLPKTNCGDCKVPTCMAFAMKLAQKKAELSECPHASEEAKSTLGAASEPPMKLFKIGGGEKACKIGGEIVMFRHEKTFCNKTAITIELKSSSDETSLINTVKLIDNFKIERVGEILTADLFFITQDSNAEDFIKAVSLVKQNSNKGVILNTNDKAALKSSLEILKADKPAILLSAAVTDDDINLAKTCDASLIVTSDSFDDLAAQTEKIKSAGITNIALNFVSDSLKKQLQNNTIIRRAALRKNFKPFGYPLFTYLKATDEYDLMAAATLSNCKYSSILVLPKFDKAMLYALFTLRQNIFTDPQKPIQVEPKIYAIGEPTVESPVFVTTNFSLTYFLVSGEIENSGISAHLIVCDAEGQSVLTAWASGKFVAETISKFIKSVDAESKIKTRKIVIPGFVAQISGELEEKLPGWQVIVGSQEAADIPVFVKNVSLT
jgi:acetyl-CoA decarbonylase/synthase complex subunit gamma